MKRRTTKKLKDKRLSFNIFKSYTNSEGGTFKWPRSDMCAICEFNSTSVMVVNSSHLARLIIILLIK